MAQARVVARPPPQVLSRLLANLPRSQTGLRDRVLESRRRTRNNTSPPPAHNQQRGSSEELLAHLSARQLSSRMTVQTPSQQNRCWRKAYITCATASLIRARPRRARRRNSPRLSSRTSHPHQRSKRLLRRARVTKLYPLTKYPVDTRSILLTPTTSIRVVPLVA
jgi:hypothetical protein